MNNSQTPSPCPILVTTMGGSPGNGTITLIHPGPSHLAGGENRFHPGASPGMPPQPVGDPLHGSKQLQSIICSKTYPS